MNRGHYKTAQEDLEKALKIMPDNQEAQKLEAEARRKYQDLEAGRNAETGMRRMKIVEIDDDDEEEVPIAKAAEPEIQRKVDEMLGPKLTIIEEDESDEE